jgi:hypothetical protein
LAACSTPKGSVQPVANPPHTAPCHAGLPLPTGDVPLYGPDGPDGPTLGVVVATNPRAAGDARLWAGAWRLRAALEWIAGQEILEAGWLVGEMQRVATAALEGASDADPV